MSFLLSKTVIPIPDEFDFSECLVFLGRSDKEVLHHIEGDVLYKAIKMGENRYLVKLNMDDRGMIVEFVDRTPNEGDRASIISFVHELFDLDKDLSGFYRMMKEDPILRSISGSYDGLRIIGMPDLFEALTWAVMGQQINLNFAYTLKQSFVEAYGDKLEFNGRTYWIYPSYERIAGLDVEDLRMHQFTIRKAEYIIGLAKAMNEGIISKERLKELNGYQQIHKALTALRGVGAWTADYVMMKCLLHPEAFPIADVGLHNAIKQQLKMDRKPTVEEIKIWTQNWRGWQAYAVFYLWRSLYG
ncbi:DNA-3-methyladenine glycosylase family protein [Falsibacillus albus]|uniref:DNA-3-methyladenine glycosylase II n=1 Tax=Falsibacillus albus TaxID=2478915 RepID=A0A3L7JU84_9BACI|nr:DNA-3-methyladenine glycosylase [Falsibacillus albus]RLQ94296.1 DNA-3-methyladenine glycosylase 2 family protein [Falsibacillus albus]